MAPATLPTSVAASTGSAIASASTQIARALASGWADSRRPASASAWRCSRSQALMRARLSWPPWIASRRHAEPREARLVVGRQEHGDAHRWKDAKRSRIARAYSASRLPVGSSAMRMVGRFTIARAMHSRCCSPPDSATGMAFSRARRPTLSSAARTRRPASSRASPGDAQRKRHVLERVAVEEQLVVLEDEADAAAQDRERRLAERGRGSARAPRPLPRVARSMPAASLRSVDLPAPECPVTTTISPAATSKLTSRSASWPPG